MKRIVMMSNVILALLFLTLTTLLITAVVLLLNGSDVLNFTQANGTHLWIGLEVSGSWKSTAGTLTANSFNAMTWLALPQMLPYIIVNLILIRLFMLYRKGLFFNLKNIQCFKWLGGLLLLQFIFVAFYPALLVTLLNMFSGSELKRAVVIQDTDIIGFIVGLIIYVIAWIMKQAQQLQQEQELVI